MLSVQPALIKCIHYLKGKFSLHIEIAYSYIPKDQTVFYGYNIANITDGNIATNYMSHYWDKGKFTPMMVDNTFDQSTFENEMVNFNEYIYQNQIQDKTYLGVYLRNVKDIGGVKLYDVINFVNPLYSELTGYAVQGTITSVLRDHLGDDTIQFEFRRGPFPKSKLEDNILKIVLTMITAFSYSIAMGIITASIAGNI